MAEEMLTDDLELMRNASKRRLLNHTETLRLFKMIDSLTRQLAEPRTMRDAYAHCPECGKHVRFTFTKPGDGT